MIRTLAIVFICVCGANAQVARPDPSHVLKQLLAKPAPRPPFEIKQTEPTNKRPDDFFDQDKRPSDDAPIDDLIDYWFRWTDRPDLRPSDKTQ